MNSHWKTNTIFLIALWIILLAASLTVMSSVVTPFLSTLQTQDRKSENWSGYGIRSDAISPQPLVTMVNASWRVPTITISQENTYSSVWIGVGGCDDHTLIQVGTEQESVNGQVKYFLWYELIPEYMIPIEDITVSPGDEILALIELKDKDTGSWLVEIDDLTTKQGFSQTFIYNSTMLTAEWIVERPTVNHEVSTLADFGSVAFTGATATIGSKAGTISGFSNCRITMQQEQQELVYVSELSDDGSSFTVTYKQPD